MRQRIGSCAMALMVAMGGCSGKKAEPHNALGEATAAALLTGVAETSAVLEPWPCAALDDAPTAPPPSLQLRGWKLDGLALVPTEGTAGAPVVGFVGDAAGDAPGTVAQLRRAAERFAESKAALVISLGGMGETAEAIAAGLRELGKADAPLVAVPGDLEPLTAHRRAVERLQKEGLPVVDGSVVRWVRLGASTIATLPGARYEAQLAAGKEGCAFDDAAVEATLSRLGNADGMAVLASWAAPRAGAETAAQGDLALRKALEQAHVAVAVVGETMRGAAGPSRAGRASGKLQVVAAGFADGEPRMPVDGAARKASAVLLKLGRAEWQMQRVELDGE